MSDHSMSSKELFTGALLGAFIGGTTVTFMRSQTAQHMKSDVSEKYHEIRDHIDDFLTSLQNTMTENVNEKTEEWSNKAKKTFEGIKERIDSLNLSEQKDLGAGLLMGSLFGAILGIGAILLIHGKPREEGIVQKIDSQVSTWKPILVELQKLIDENSRPHKSEQLLDNKLDHLLEFAVEGLKLWNKIKRKI